MPENKPTPAPHEASKLSSPSGSVPTGAAGVNCDRVWSCKIGVRRQVDLSPGADLPMRRAVEDAFRSVTGLDAEFNFSGWGGKLDESELAVVENRLPSAEHYRDWLIREAAPDLYEALVEARNILMNSDAESGCCMCGDPVASHTIGSGHAPVDSHLYMAGRTVEKIDAALAKALGQ